MKVGTCTLVDAAARAKKQAVETWNHVAATKELVARWSLSRELAVLCHVCTVNRGGKKARPS